MNISKKIIVFFSLVSLLIILFISVIVNKRVESTEELEKRYMVKNIKKLHNILENNGEYLEKIAYEYANNDVIINSASLKQKDKIQTFFENKSNFMERLNLSYFIVFDKKKNFVYEESYDLSSNEYLTAPYEIIDFFKNANLDQYIENGKNNYLTVSYEKTMFKIEKIIKDSELVGYVFVARTIDSSFLSNITEVIQDYTTLISFYKYPHEKILRYGHKQFTYDIQKINNHTMFAYLKLYDEYENKSFYIRIQNNRELYDELVTEIKYGSYLFMSTLIIILFLFFVFMNRVFTKRIRYITNKIKEASCNESLRIKLKIDYNDEISYLSSKINEMFASINAHQSLKLKKERDFLQSVLDTQQNIILITDGKKIESVNRKFHEIFDSQESFLSNVALLDNKTKANLVAIAKQYENQEKIAKFQLINEPKFFTFDVSRLDMKKYLICMNDVSTFNKKINHLEIKASIDELTAVYNKSTITEFTKKFLENKNFCFAIFDIDFFKKVNDSYGHYIGDCVLKDLAKLVSQNISKNDILGRFGGEEFLLLFHDVETQDMYKVCNRIREIIEEHSFKYDDTLLDITISLGCTYCFKGETFTQIYQRADKALYQAKHEGRNNVVVG